LLIDYLLTPIVESTYLNRDMCKFESSQKDESRWQSTDSSKAYRNTSGFKSYVLNGIICSKMCFPNCISVVRCCIQSLYCASMFVLTVLLQKANCVESKSNPASDSFRLMFAGLERQSQRASGDTACDS